MRKIRAKFTPCRFGLASGGKFRRGDPIKGDKKKRMAEFFGKAPGRKSALMRIIRIDTSSGFKSRSEYCNFIVAAAQSHPACVRKTRTTRRIGDLACASCDPETIESHLNNGRIRKEIDHPILEFMAVGAAGSEAMNS